MAYRFQRGPGKVGAAVFAVLINYCSGRHGCSRRAICMTRVQKSVPCPLSQINDKCDVSKLPHPLSLCLSNCLPLCFACIYSSNNSSSRMRCTLKILKHHTCFSSTNTGCTSPSSSSFLSFSNELFDTHTLTRTPSPDKFFVLSQHHTK